MKTITATLAALLLAGASTAALAQDRDRADRGDRPQAQDRQQNRQAPQGGRAPAGQAAAPAAHAPAAPAAQQAAPARSFERHDGPNRDGGAQRFQGQGQRFQGGAPAPTAPAPQRFDRGGAPGPGAQRQFDQQRGPREVIPPTGDRGQFDRRGGGQVDRRDGGRADARGDHRDGVNPWRGGERWQPGRAPPVFWSQNRYRIGGYRAPYGYYVRAWGFGEFLPRGWYGQDYWVGDFLDYGLPYPPPGYEWVRVGGDALMIDRYTGRIVQVVRGIFW
jgi:Ni/Co efflux regulator RcnB